MIYKHDMSKKHTLKHIKNYIESFDYKLLSDEYKNNKSKLELQCDKGHIYKTSYHRFQQGDRCPSCMDTKNTYEYIKQKIENEGYKLLSTNYVNNRTKLKLQCPEGHIIKMLYLNFQKGSRCYECFGTKKKNNEDIQNYLNTFNYKLLSEYKNIHSKIKIQCPEGHIYDVLFNNFKRNNTRCPFCNDLKSWSKSEKEIVDFIKQNYFGVIKENDRTVVKNYWTNRFLELDIYLPEIRKAIEFNGLYWHSKDKYVKWKDEMKKKQCIQKQIDLLIIQEQDWINDKICCLNKIKGFIGD